MFCKAALNSSLKFTNTSALIKLLLEVRIVEMDW